MAAQEICAPLQNLRVRVPVKDPVLSTQAIPAIRVVLRSIQRSDVNLLAAYRKIPLLTTPPASISYTRANTRAVYRKSVEAIEQMLAKFEGPKALADRSRLARLDRRETHLAFAKQRYPNIRANTLYLGLDARGRGRIQVSAELPILYPKGRLKRPPLIKFPKKPDDITPRRVREQKLDPQPFLKTLPVFRYLRS
jgi:hypothetical protein